VHCIVNFENVKVSGAFSFEIVNSSWTSEDIILAIRCGTATMPFMIDGGPIFHDGKIIAKIGRALPVYKFDEELKFEKNTKLPYFFGFEDKDEVRSYFIDDDGWFDDKEIVLAAKHLEDDGFGTILVILKTEKGKILYTHIEDTLRSRNGPNKFYADTFSVMSYNQKLFLTEEAEFTKEYKPVLTKLLSGI